MLLTTKGRYAVMALVDMATQGKSSDATKAVCLADISARQDITVAYLEQIFSKLKNAGLVFSVRGPGGGYTLAKKPTEMHIAEIIEAVDDKVKMLRCSTDSDVGCMSTKAKCATHELWDSLERQIENYLSSVTVDDVINKNTDKTGYKNSK